MDEVREKIHSIMKRKFCGVLVTRGREYPYPSVVAYAGSADLKSIYFGTMPQTRKFENARRFSKVSFLIDSRTNTERDFAEAAAVTALGKAVALSGAEKKEKQEQLIDIHPQLMTFFSDPNCSIVKIDVERYIYVEHFQNVYELEV